MQEKFECQCFSNDDETPPHHLFFLEYIFYNDQKHQSDVMPESPILYSLHARKCSLAHDVSKLSTLYVE